MLLRGKQGHSGTTVTNGGNKSQLLVLVIRPISSAPGKIFCQ